MHKSKLLKQGLKKGKKKINPRYANQHHQWLWFDRLFEAIYSIPYWSQDTEVVFITSEINWRISIFCFFPNYMCQHRRGTKMPREQRPKLFTITTQQPGIETVHKSWNIRNYLKEGLITNCKLHPWSQIGCLN